MFEGAVSATFDAFGIDAVDTPENGNPISVRVIARRPDTIVGFGETRISFEANKCLGRVQGISLVPSMCP